MLNKAYIKNANNGEKNEENEKNYYGNNTINVYCRIGTC